MTTSTEYRQRLYAERSHYARLACTLSEGMLMHHDRLTPDQRAQLSRDLHDASHARDVLDQQIDWEQFKVDRANGVTYIGAPPQPAWSN